MLKPGPERIAVHDASGFAAMRRAGRLAAECLDAVGPEVLAGVQTEDLDRFCEAFIRANGATPAPLGYRGFPKATCISVNHVVCHGIPGKKRLRPGDILNIDVTVILDGWYGDTSRMYAVPPVKPAAMRLIDTVYEALAAGIREIRPEARLGDVGAAIQACARAARCSVVREFCGHGIGRVFHDAPSVLHYGVRRTGEELRPGMIFTVEPMINFGRPETKVLPDGWTAVTRDRSLSAQCEHTVGVTEAGVEIFTLSPAGRFHPWREGAGEAFPRDVAPVSPSTSPVSPEPGVGPAGRG